MDVKNRRGRPGTRVFRRRPAPTRGEWNGSWPGLLEGPLLIFLPLHMSDTPPPDHGSRLFRRTLLSVLAVPVATLLLLWLLPTRYTRSTTRRARARLGHPRRLTR